MAVFEYTALNAKGRKIRGVIDSESIRAARQRLKAQGIYPTEIKESRSQDLVKSRDVRVVFRERKVSPTTLALVTRQFATLVGAGMALIEALKALIDQLDQPRLKRVFAEVCDRVNEGSTLAEALRAHPRVFPRLYCNMVASGEATGRIRR